VVHDAVHPVVAVEEHRTRTDVLGEALRLLAEIQQGETALDGLDPGTLAGLTSDEPGSKDAYVRALLAGCEGELAARMLGRDGSG